MMKMKEERDCKNPIIIFLRRPESILEWLRQPSEKMKKAKQDYKGILVRYKETKCEVEVLNEELTKSYSKIKFLEIEVIQANAKVEWVASKKLDEVIAHQKPFF